MSLPPVRPHGTHMGLPHPTQLSSAVRLSLETHVSLPDLFLQEGYGCSKDAKAGKEWAEKAAARGYKMQGVYCEL